MIIYPDLSVLFMLLPIIFLMLSVANARQTQARQLAAARQAAPAAITARNYSAELIALDEEVSFAELEEDPTLQARAHQARAHLNQAFQTYSQHFGAEGQPTGEAQLVHHEMSHNLRAAKAALTGQPVTRQALVPAPAMAQVVPARGNDLMVVSLGLLGMSMMMGSRRRVW